MSSEPLQPPSTDPELVPVNQSRSPVRNMTSAFCGDTEMITGVLGGCGCAGLGESCSSPVWTFVFQSLGLGRFFQFRSSLSFSL